jgi:hypothetical protein
MKLVYKGQKTLIVSVVVLLIALIAGPVLAGGWAEVTMDNLPGEIHAGDSVRMSFMVLQHGKTPVHFLGDSDIAVVPLISGANVKTGESVEFTAVADKSEVGRFYVDVVFPSDGEWSWTVTPNPLAGATEFAPLTILPELKAPVVEAGLTAETATVSTATAEAAGLSAVLPWTGGLLLVVGVGLMGFLISRRKRPLTQEISQPG